MNEKIGARITLDEPIAFATVKPLHYTLFFQLRYFLFFADLDRAVFLCELVMLQTLNR